MDEALASFYFQISTYEILDKITIFEDIDAESKIPVGVTGLTKYKDTKIAFARYNYDNSSKIAIYSKTKTKEIVDLSDTIQHIQGLAYNPSEFFFAWGMLDSKCLYFIY